MMQLYKFKWLQRKALEAKDPFKLENYFTSAVSLSLQITLHWLMFTMSIPVEYQPLIRTLLFPA